MTRATEVFTTAAIVIGLYLAMVLQLIPLPQKIQDEIVPVLWIILLRHIRLERYDIWECPEAYDELMREIAEAKGDLRSKGMNIN
ncbi:unnamed protein product [Umbelopsis vinacea]